MPGGAFDVSCVSRQRGTEDCNPYACRQRRESYQCRPRQCNCSNNCVTQSNGYSRCTKSCSTCYDTCYREVHDTCYKQCPVYEDWCTYKYYEWPVISEKQDGGDAHEVRWPPMKKTGPHQRIDRHERYLVKFKRDEDVWKLKPKSLKDFKKYTRGHYWRIKTNRAGMVWPLHRLEAEGA